ncbi:M16 family metallopeptidase [Paenibacillus illinoisensis]|uniref:M16 family metallopeptidase n=1 Tax=Paenibacillus illinoisensis TaxID=59845 RepID=UPI00301CC203
MSIAMNTASVRRRLSNGLYVSIFPEPQFHHTFVSWSVSYGSIHDVILPGKAHFLEHMMFYNPDERPVKSMFHHLGASTSALTRYDVTTYQLACTGQLTQSLNLFARMLANPYFTKSHVEQERSAILQELSMYADQPSWRALQQLTQMMYGNNHPISLDVAGTPDSVNRVTPEELYHAYRERYTTGNMAVTIIGPVEPRAVVEMLEQFLPLQNQIDDRFQPTSYIQVGEQAREPYVELECSGLPLPLVRYGFRAEEGMCFKDQIACMIGLEALLGETSDFHTMCSTSGLLGHETTWDHYYRKEFAFSNACSYSTDPLVLYNRVEELCVQIQEGNVFLHNLEYARRRWLSRYYADMDSLKQRCMHVSEFDVIGLDYMQLAVYAAELAEEDILSGLRKMAMPSNLRMVALR